MRLARHFTSAIMALVLVLAVSFPVEAQTMYGNAKTGQVMQNGHKIQRIYNRGGIVYNAAYTVTYHFDQQHVYTVEVPSGEGIGAFGCALWKSKGFSQNSYTPYGASGTWGLYGFKENDGTASPDNVNNGMACTRNMDLYVVWQKDCSCAFYAEGGVYDDYGSFTDGGWSRGYAYFNNGNTKPYRIKMPTVHRDGYKFRYILNQADYIHEPGISQWMAISTATKYAQGTEYDVTEGTSFSSFWISKTKTYTYTGSFDTKDIIFVGITNSYIPSGSNISVSIQTEGNLLAAMAYEKYQHPGGLFIYNSDKGISPGNFSVQTNINAHDGAIVEEWCQAQENYVPVYTLSASGTSSGQNGLTIAFSTRGQGMSSNTGNATVTVTVTEP